ncbi:hypothetical protein FA13DRAFT_1799574 [Coprinellus micaceus]|uniref:DUF6533 domain-containing protein n=1 Tax=Coprinellus micaceus TaxID=71717 RepID=A0A4Y7SIJ1_COPMI|nr:hypothetical protein FA13DRAFT_1799574 [Coprinellus micaceus]
MDPEFVEYVQAMIPVYQDVRTINYIQLGISTALFYHYATTFHEEVSQVWPQKPWKIGKVLFMTTRYSAMAAMAMEINGLRNFATDNKQYVILRMSATIIMQIYTLSAAVARMLAGTGAEATIWLCLYALLGGKPKYMLLLVLLFLGFMVPIYVLQAITLYSQHAYPPDELDMALGYACAYTPPVHLQLRQISAYISFSKTVVTMAVGLVTILVRYKKQTHSLIRVIRQEGGMYFMSALILRFLSGLRSTTSVNLNDRYYIIDGLAWLCVNVFADRLLLLLRKVDDPGTQNVVSTLMFNRYDTESSLPSGIDENDTRESETDELYHEPKEKQKQVEGLESQEVPRPLHRETSGV